MRHQRTLSGFTLIELLGVIVIIGILATFSAISISGAVKRARDALRERDLSNVKSALELYNQDNSSYPTGEGDVHDILAETLQKDGNYIRELPKDPRASTNGNYHYKSDDGSNYVLSTKLEYPKTNPTLSASDFPTCAEAVVSLKKGNGVVRDSSGSCFRLTND